MPDRLGSRIDEERPGSAQASPYPLPRRVRPAQSPDAEFLSAVPMFAGLSEPLRRQIAARADARPARGGRMALPAGRRRRQPVRRALRPPGGRDRAAEHRGGARAHARRRRRRARAADARAAVRVGARAAGLRAAAGVEHRLRGAALARAAVLARADARARAPAAREPRARAARGPAAGDDRGRGGRRGRTHRQLAESLASSARGARHGDAARRAAGGRTPRSTARSASTTTC